ncbi:hypothetical protein HDV05_005714 [Chytridiales sp. JEL 0842]|nr:hypothetical protein HDV05_005714 [Chytridiales sp. JEL 0842]
MSTSIATAEKAQMTLGTKYLFSPAQWLMFWRKADGATAKAGLRCVVQAGTIHAVLTGKYRCPTGEVRLNKAALKQAVVETKVYDFHHIFNPELERALSLKASVPSASCKIRAETLSNSRMGSGPKIMVVEGDLIDVALQLRRIFKQTPCALLSVNSSMPGGFYRRGGPTLEEQLCRRSNLWDCLDDPYGHSLPNFTTQDKDEYVSKRSYGNLSSLSIGNRQASVNGSKESLKSSLSSVGSLSGKKMREWSYPISGFQCIFAPSVNVFRSSEQTGYEFLKNPGKVACICIVPELIREYAITTEKSCNLSTWKLKNKGKEPRMTARSAKTYAKRLEFVLKVAMKEGRRIVVLSATGCGAHGTPPRHSAEIHRDVLQKVDPRGENFDLIAFALLEDVNSYKPHNPEGTIRPFAEVLTAGNVTPISHLELTKEVSDIGEEMSRMKQSRSVDALSGSHSKKLTDDVSKISLNNGNNGKSVVFNSATLLRKNTMGSMSLDSIVVDYDTPRRALVIRLVAGNCKVRKIQVLSHHFKIPTRLEFYMGRSQELAGNIKLDQSVEGTYAEVAAGTSLEKLGQETSTHRRLNSASSLQADTERLLVSRGSTASGLDRSSQIVEMDSKGRPVNFTRLGYVTLGDNASTGYKARELKSIHIDAEGDYLKIVAHKCYINPLNLYNQVGIVAVNLMGDIYDSDYFVKTLSEHSQTLLGLDPLATQNDWNLRHQVTNPALWSSINSASMPYGTESMKDLAFGIYQDEDIAKLIGAIAEAKDVAVREENYKMAKALKTMYELCKKAGEEIAQLQIAKAKAVRDEDYEAADEIKTDIEIIRRALFTKMDELGLKKTEKGIIIQADFPGLQPALNPPPPAVDDQTVDAPRDPTPSPDAPAPPPPIDVLQSTVEQPEIVKTPTISNPLPEPRLSTPPPPPSPPKRPSSPPVPAVLVQAVQGLPDPSPTDVSPTNRNPGDPDDPEQLSEEQMEHYQHVITVYGSFLVRCLLSKQFKLREKALEDVAKRLDIWDRRQRRLPGVHRSENSKKHSRRGRSLDSRDGENGKERSRSRKRGKSEGRSKSRDEEGKKSVSFNKKTRGSSKKHISHSGDESNLSDDDQETVRVSWTKEVPAKSVDKDEFVNATFVIVQKGIDDTREKVTMLALSVWDQLTLSLVFKFMDSMFPPLLLKASDMNPRIKQGCMDLAASITDAYHTQPYTTVKYLLKPLTTKKGTIPPWRYAKVRLEVLHRAIKDYGVDDAHEGYETGLTVASVMAFTEPQLHDKNAEVRDAAIKVVVELILAAGDESVAGYLENLRPQQLQILKDKLAEAKGQPVKPKPKKKTDAPWRANTAGSSKSSKLLDDDDVVERLKKEVESLRDMVEENEAKVKKSKTASKPGSRASKTPVPPAKPKVESKVGASQGSLNSAFDEEIIMQDTFNHFDMNDLDFAPSKAWSMDNVCIFCDEQSPDFTEEGLDTHYWRDCPMLCTCPLCRQIVEVPNLTDHMIRECENQHRVKLCPRCCEAVLATEFNAHVSRSTCAMGSGMPNVFRCPLCHMDVISSSGGETGWKRHLLKGLGCAGSDRKPRAAATFARPQSPSKIQQQQQFERQSQRTASLSPSRQNSLGNAGGSENTSFNNSINNSVVSRSSTKTPTRQPSNSSTSPQRPRSVTPTNSSIRVGVGRNSFHSVASSSISKDGSITKSPNRTSGVSSHLSTDKSSVRSPSRAAGGTSSFSSSYSSLDKSTSSVKSPSRATGVGAKPKVGAVRPGVRTGVGKAGVR